MSKDKPPKNSETPENVVTITDYFERRAKKFLKKFDTLGAELDELRIQLLENPKKGVNIGTNLYKIRLGSASKGTG